MFQVWKFQIEQKNSFMFFYITAQHNRRKKENITYKGAHAGYVTHDWTKSLPSVHTVKSKSRTKYTDTNESLPISSWVYGKLIRGGCTHYTYIYATLH